MSTSEIILRTFPLNFIETLTFLFGSCPVNEMYVLQNEEGQEKLDSESVAEEECGAESEGKTTKMTLHT